MPILLLEPLCVTFFLEIYGGYFSSMRLAIIRLHRAKLSVWSTSKASVLLCLCFVASHQPAKLDSYSHWIGYSLQGLIQVDFYLLNRLKTASSHCTEPNQANTGISKRCELSLWQKRREELKQYEMVHYRDKETKSCTPIIPTVSDE